MSFGIIFLISWFVLAVLAFSKKQSAIISLLGTFICAALITAIFAPKDSPRQLTAEEITNNQLNADSDSAKIRAKEYMEASLKAPATALWPSYNEFATARAEDKKGKPIKGLWNVTGYVDSQNSYGALLRTKFLVKVQKKGDNWSLVKLSTY
jgi:hypothetical protein